MNLRVTNLRTMNLKNLVAFSVITIFSACMTTPVSESTVSDSQGSSYQDSENKDWLEVAQNSQDMNEFAVALNNLISLGDFSNISPLMLMTDHLEELMKVGAFKERPKASRSNRFAQFSQKIGSVCIPASESDWELTRIYISQGQKIGSLDYRIYFEDTYSWCTLHLEQLTNSFKIVNITNNYYNLDFPDYVRSFALIDSNPKVEFENGNGTTGFYQSIEDGYDAFNQYIERIRLDKDIPLVHMIQISLLEAELNYDDNESFDIYLDRLENFITVGGESKEFPVQQLYLNSAFDTETSLLDRNLKTAESNTGDSSGIRYLISSLLLDYRKVEQARKMLLKALKSDPSNENLYFEMFRVHLRTEEFVEAVLVLRILQERFDYEFSRDYFEKNDSYTLLVASDSFNKWMP